MSSSNSVMSSPAFFPMFTAILRCQFPCAEIEENENKKMKDNELVKFCYELTCIFSYVHCHSSLSISLCRDRRK
jgi:hypothetical protein